MTESNYYVGRRYADGPTDPRPCAKCGGNSAGYLTGQRVCIGCGEFEAACTCNPKPADPAPKKPAPDGGA